jgi:hypothetical protein
MGTAVVCNHTETVPRKEKHLPIPRIGTQRPSVRTRDDRALAPIFVVDCCAVSDCNCALYLSPELVFGEAETPAVVGFIGSSTGAPLSLTKTTMNFAGLVLLAFRPTV